jgi:MFS family permease
MKNTFHAPLAIQSFALAAFWGMVTFGRVFFAAMKKYFREGLAFQISPFISSLAFILIATLPPNAQYWAVAAFGLSGFGCSTLLPLIISFGSQQLEMIASSIPGMVISFYLLGYGIAAFGVGPLEEIARINLRAIYAIGSLIAFLLGIISLMIIETDKKGATP